MTSCYDLNEQQPLENINFNQWNLIGAANVYYSQSSELSFQHIKARLLEVNADVIYINGLYSLPFVVYPLLIKKLFFKHKKIVVAPRGMLQAGALKIRATKKKSFLALFKLLGLQKELVWHATDEQEKEDVIKIFGEKAKVIIAPNVPKQPAETLELLSKSKNELRLVYLSLITEKKNLLLALSILSNMSEQIVFDIYGPIKDKNYWEDCELIIHELPSNIVVNYKGDVQPDNVQETFKKYHALFLPTKGENFGHAIYECLSVGRPVIISDTTPWKNLKAKHAGYDCDLCEPTQFENAIKELYAVEGTGYNELCKGAYGIAKEYWDGNDYVDSYRTLFY